MIRVDGLTKRYGRFTAVDDVSFRVTPGEAVALWGANGAGKTTAIRCLLGLERFHGSLHVAGHDVRRRGKAARRAIGYVPQELALYDDLRLPEALAFFARLKHAPRTRVPIVLDEIGLSVHRRKRVRELSGGMKQRLALGAALLADPPLLVLDELTSNLDAAAQGGFMSLLRTQKQGGKTILFTSHHLPEVEMLADRVLVLDRGRLARTCAAVDLAETLGMRCVLHVRVAPDALDRAVTVLRDRGFDATPNARGLHVAVAPRDKIAALHALGGADIAVRDFDVDEAPTTGGIQDA